MAARTGKRYHYPLDAVYRYRHCLHRLSYGAGRTGENRRLRTMEKSIRRRIGRTLSCAGSAGNTTPHTKHHHRGTAGIRRRSNNHRQRINIVVYKTESVNGTGDNHKSVRYTENKMRKIILIIVLTTAIGVMLVQLLATSPEFPSNIPQSECVLDEDCPPNHHCQIHIFPACPYCDGGQSYNICHPIF